MTEEPHIESARIVRAIVDPDKELKRVKKLSIDQLTPFDILRYRADEFFPKMPDTYPEKLDPRNYSHSMYADSRIHSAIRKLKSEHSQYQRAIIRYLMLKVGVIQLMLAYGDRVHEIKDIISELDDNPLTDGAVDGIPVFSINQTAGHIKELRSGFTQSDNDFITELSEDLGIHISSLLVVAFWILVVKYDMLRQDQVEYGRDIINQFEKHLAMRIVILKQIQTSAGT